MKKAYGDLLTAINRRYYAVSRSHSESRKDSEEIKRLNNELATDSTAVSGYVKDMRDELYDLVKAIGEAKHAAGKKASRDKLLRTLVTSLKIFNVGVGLGASLSQLAPQPAGLAATVALGSANVLIASATERTDKYRKGQGKFYLQSTSVVDLYH